MNSLKRWLVILVGLAFLGTSTAGAHLHLCFDGTEPPTSIHLFDGPEDVHTAGVSQGHNDVDVALADRALAKVYKYDFTSPVLPSSWEAPSFNLVEALSESVQDVEQPLSTIRFRLPPQRGPPV